MSHGIRAGRWPSEELLRSNRHYWILGYAVAVVHKESYRYYGFLYMCDLLYEHPDHHKMLAFKPSVMRVYYKAYKRGYTYNQIRKMNLNFNGVICKDRLRHDFRTRRERWQAQTQANTKILGSVGKNSGLLGRNSKGRKTT